MTSLKLKDMQDKEQCPVCLRAGLIKYLKSYQINLDEAVVLCENKLCTYPLSLNSSVAPTFSRKLGDVTSSRKNEGKAKVMDSQMALQTKMSSHMHKTGLRLQKDAIGIQTGSPQLKKKLKTKQIPYKKRAVTSTFLNQNGFDSYPPFLLQNGSESFPNFKSFTEANRNTLGALGQTGYYGPEGVSDKDFILNSSGESLESSSTTSSNSSVAEGSNFSNKISNSYQSFQVRESQKGHLPNSLPILSSQSITYNGHLDQVNSIIVSDKRIINEHKKSDNLSIVENEKSFDKVQNTDMVNQNKNINPDCNSQVQMDESLQKVEERVGNEIKTAEKSNVCLSKLAPYRDKTVVEHRSGWLRYPTVFPQWRNKDALCWLDVILCLSVHNESLKSLVFCDTFDKKNLIYKLFAAHNQACKLIQDSENKLVLQECEISDTDSNQFKEIDKCSNLNSKNQAQPNSDLSKENIPVSTVSRGACLENTPTEDLLNEVREEVWTKLKCQLKCEKGQNESPVFAFPLLLKESPAVEEMFKMVYRFDFKCSKCGKTESSDHINTLPTFPTVVKDFNIGDPQHIKKCFQCGNTTDTRNMVYKSLPKCLLMHFTDGLPETTWEELQFGFHGYLYTVTGIVQYINNPDHFIAWLRNPYDNKWFKCDDLRSTICQKRSKEPAFSCSQIHIIMWERLKMKSKICRQVAIDADDSLHIEKQKLEKKTHLNFDLITEKESKHTELGNETTCNILKHINKVNDDSTGGKVKCSINSVRLLDTSPCSTHSTGSSDSLHLPNFVAFTGSNEGVLRPIPMPIVSVIPITSNNNANIKNNIQSKTRSDNTVDCSEKKGIKVKNTSLLGNLIVKLERKMSLNGANDKNEQMVGKNELNMPCSQISGPKTIIKPSTVFCVPKKSSEADLNAHLSNVVKSDSVKEHVNTCGDSTCKEDDTALPGLSIHSENGTWNNTRKRKSNVTPENEIIDKKLLIESKDDKYMGIEHSENVEKHDHNVELKTANEQKSKSRLSQSSRFKVPFKLNKKPQLSKDAFFTLDTDTGTPGSSGSNTPMSPISPAFSGNLNYLNSVKQYLLSRTTGRPDPKFKFEGLNLKSSSSYGSFDLSELGLSCNASALPAECNSFDSESLSNSSSHSTISKKSELVNKLIQKLEQSPISGVLNQTTLKRKLEMNATKSPKKKLQGNEVDQDTLSSGNTSLKENSSIHHQKKVPGGKSMRLVRKLAVKAENASSEHNISKTNIGSLELNNQMVNTKVAKCDSESVLQDLYEALNIPYSSVDATMSDIMTDVDDILGFVNVDDLVPDPHHINRPLSCFEGSSAENQKHSD
ncbi:uncharacterized protein LOC132713590 isoform X2 [Ruditapes philippinarum]|nr:uncharacterized protein LOC132713590 isoform X2 [Ruditapes philippinarum]